MAVEVNMFNGGRRGGRFGRPGYRFRRFSAMPEFSEEFLADTSDLDDFIKKLTDANDKEIEGYAAEIRSNSVFHENLGGNRRGFGRRFYGSGIGGTLGTVLYALCRKLKPDTVVETGVSGGVSSSFILCALEENQHGELFSIDLPWGEQSGWMIPDYLRHRWHLEQGRSAEKLPPLLEKLGAIDMFLHDSEHSYENMFREYESAWAYLKTGGILLSHNVEWTRAFPDFCKSARVKGFLLNDMGGTVKV